MLLRAFVSCLFPLLVTDDIASNVDADGEDYEIDEEREAYYKEDPKKALKKFFDREGLEFEYEVEEEGAPRARVFTVRVRYKLRVEEDRIRGEREGHGWSERKRNRVDQGRVEGKGRD